jgi:hypothetical protein
VSAGVLLVREAGGLVFDRGGEPHGPDAAFTLAAMPSNREELLDVITHAHSPAGAR